VSAIALLLGVATSVLRDADPEAIPVETVPDIAAPAQPSHWPVLAAGSVVAAAVGLVASPVVFVIGLIFAGLVMLEWTVLAWSERATGDPEVNRTIRHRLMSPIEVPVAGALAVLILVVSVSRILLALDKDASSAVAIVIAALVLGLGFLVAYRPRLSKDAVTGVLVAIVLAVIGAGIVAAASGTREFEHHEDDHAELAPEGAEGEG
jgi:carbon starvation protein CstA